MNNEVNNNANNELEVKSNNSSKLIIASLAILLIGALGFIIYDKILKKEETKECFKNECQCEKCDNTNNSLGEKISSLKKIIPTTSNQIVKIGKKEYKVRRDDKYNLLINDEYIYDENGFEIGIDANGNSHLYLTDKFMFNTGSGQMDEHLDYAIDENGKINVINDKYIQMKDFKVVDGYLHATGCFTKFDEEAHELYCEYKDVIIKYIDNTLVVTENK